MSHQTLPLSAEHREAAERRRRIIVEYDAFDPGEMLGGDFDQWLEFRFHLVDQPGSQIDSIMWELHPSSDRASYPSDVLPYPHLTSLETWHQQGIDWLERVVAETHRRGLEAWWTHRISEVDADANCNLEMEELSPLKAAHPEWTLPSWWWQGMWNLAEPGLRAHKVAVLRELAERYDLDGIQVNFARHLPVLPVGRQWELRAAPTDLMRQVRAALQEVAAKRGRPILLAAKVPETVAGCQVDGLDVVTWAREGLVDLLSLGSRTLTMDVGDFRAALGETPVKLCPCFDDHHASDGYRHAPIEVLRGVFGNWLAQGADGVETFNWSTALPEYYASRGIPDMNVSAAHAPAYLEVGQADTMADKDLTCVVERRGVFPWSQGYFCRNAHFALPATLANHGEPTTLSLRVDVPVGDARQAELAVVVYTLQPDDLVGATLNAEELPLAARDDSHRDPQLFSPAPQPPAGTARSTEPDPAQRLTLLTYALRPGRLRRGENHVALWVASRGSFPIGADIQVEKVEARMRF